MIFVVEGEGEKLQEIFRLRVSRIYEESSTGRLCV